ncbi:hypothetical protein Y032_0036g3153 [Ancylostoma ceylanicum]|uniref:Uncharacterized protein n=1 Tax=Ancylostoma ceylanicum TaxID=53326 RepID=A0A016UJT4_9BILA|nr:hypothetical protein Y032_0036g3153 [Ancylostoma ceylanicum]
MVLALHLARCSTGAGPGQEKNSPNTLSVTILASIARFGEGHVSFGEPRKCTSTDRMDKSTQVHTQPSKIYDMITVLG